MFQKREYPIYHKKMKFLSFILFVFNILAHFIFILKVPPEFGSDFFLFYPYFGFLLSLMAYSFISADSLAPKSIYFYSYGIIFFTLLNYFNGWSSSFYYVSSVFFLDLILSKVCVKLRWKVMISVAAFSSLYFSDIHLIITIRILISLVVLVLVNRFGLERIDRVSLNLFTIYSHIWYYFTLFIVAYLYSSSAFLSHFFIYFQVLLSVALRIVEARARGLLWFEFKGKKFELIYFSFAAASFVLLNWYFDRFDSFEIGVIPFAFFVVGLIFIRRISFVDA